MRHTESDKESEGKKTYEDRTENECEIELEEVYVKESEREEEFNYEEENHRLYQQTMNEIHAPEELLERVNAGKEKGTIRRLARFGYAFAAAAAIFITSNMITYAATGESWTEKLVIYINGEEYECDAQYTTDGDGDIHMNVNAATDNVDVYIDVEVDTENLEKVEILMDEMSSESDGYESSVSVTITEDE